MPLRYRLRTLLAAVAVAGLLAALVVARRHDLARRAAFHAAEAVRLDAQSQADAQIALAIEGKRPDPVAVFLDPSSNVNHRVASSLDAARADYHANLRDKNRQAAAAPWFPVADDPPPPP